MYYVPRRKCLQVIITVTAFLAVISIYHIFNTFNTSTESKQVLGQEAAYNFARNIFGNFMPHNVTTENVTESVKPVTLLCWVLCDPKDLDKRVINVKNTWGKRCDIMLYMSSTQNDTFPTIGLNVTAGRSHIATKSRAAWTYIHDHYIEKADFFVKADPDTYIVVENLKQFLQEKNSSEPEFYGHMMVLPSSKKTYASGGPGIILTRESVRRLVEKAFKLPKNCMPDGQSEDYKTGYCLQQVGGRAVNGRDRSGKERFYIFNVKTFILAKWPKWYLSYVKDRSKAGLDVCCSEYPISFHYISTSDFYLLEYLIYKVRLRYS